MTPILVASDAAAVEGIHVEAFPTAGRTTSIGNLHSSTTAVEITYQPDAPIARTERLEVQGSDVDWTPQGPGIVKITALSGPKGEVVGSVERSVQFDGVPGSGVAVFLVAALVLFGGSAWALRLLLREQDGE